MAGIPAPSAMMPCLVGANQPNGGDSGRQLARNYQRFAERETLTTQRIADEINRRSPTNENARQTAQLSYGARAQGTRGQSPRSLLQ